MTLDFIAFMVLFYLFLFICALLWHLKEIFISVVLLTGTFGAFIWALFRAGILHQ